MLLILIRLQEKSLALSFIEENAEEVAKTPGNNISHRVCPSLHVNNMSGVPCTFDDIIK
jgi:hypothetical protein